jgi:hypothetical protein
VGRAPGEQRGNVRAHCVGRDGCAPEPKMRIHEAVEFGQYVRVIGGQHAEVVFGRWTFMHVGTIVLERTPEGAVSEFMPQARYAKASTTRLNPHGGGPFCRFRIPGAQHRAGVYVLTVADDVMYVGETQDLAHRWGLSQYGSIQPKNCYVGGQSTNCKINARILTSTKASKLLDLFFFESNDRHAIQDWLIENLHPPWNGR